MGRHDLCGMQGAGPRAILNYHDEGERGLRQEPNGDLALTTVFSMEQYMSTGTRLD